MVFTVTVPFHYSLFLDFNKPKKHENSLLIEKHNITYVSAERIGRGVPYKVKSDVIMMGLFNNYFQTIDSIPIRLN